MQLPSVLSQGELRSIEARAIDRCQDAGNQTPLTARFQTQAKRPDQALHLCDNAIATFRHSRNVHYSQHHSQPMKVGHCGSFATVDRD